MINIVALIEYFLLMLPYIYVQTKIKKLKNTL
jgi:hypothetical protein